MVEIINACMIVHLQQKVAIDSYYNSKGYIHCNHWTGMIDWNDGLQWSIHGITKSCKLSKNEVKMS